MGNALHDLLGERPYHSIGHVPGSRVGPGDHSMDEGTAGQFLDPGRWKGPQERIVVQEKVDGTCVCVIKKGPGEIIPALRSGHRAETSPHEQHHRFAAWVDLNWVKFDALLESGERVCGEWCAQAHGIIYDRLPTLFFAFDIRREDRWLPTLDVMRRCAEVFIETVPLLYYGPPLPLEQVKRMTNRSQLRQEGPPEGVVLRREFGGQRVDIAKYVRHDHKAGIFLPDTDEAVVTEPVWHHIVQDPSRPEG